MIKKGIYQHFKGGFYEVKDIATHHETGAKFAIYSKLEKDDLYIREISEFNDMVNDKNDKDIQVPRFKLIEDENSLKFLRKHYK